MNNIKLKLVNSWESDCGGEIPEKSTRFPPPAILYGENLSRVGSLAPFTREAQSWRG